MYGYGGCFYGVKDLNYILCRLGDVLNTLVPILVALGVVVLIWGIIQYVIGGGDEAKKKGRDKIVYGLIGLAVIIGLWGLVYVLVDTFDVGGYAPDPYEIQNLLPYQP